MTRQITWRWLLLVCAVLLARLAAGAETVNHCLECHSQLDPPVGVSRDSYSTDIHAQKGLTCASCHGGDPAKEDDQAMSKAAGFRGRIERKQVPEVCGKCHSDAAYIHGYDPSLRTDQYAQYQTSVHGKQLAKGDTHVAVCTDCHSVHGIRPATDPRSTVNPLNVAKTCSQCHADAAYMKSYKLASDQFAGYSASVHHAAMVERGDLSAPTCTTCHGNHGAAPPGVASVENVCSTCHVFQAQLFDKSPHKQAFASAGLPSCVTCHKNHRVVHPTDASLGAGPTSYCTDCHTQGDGGYTAAVTMQRDLNGLERAITDADIVLTSAEQSGMEVSQAKLELTQARDALTKARVSVHSFQVDGLSRDVTAGTKVAEATRRAGVNALQERDYRRMGLGVSLLTIVLVLAGLGFYIREIEKNGANSH